MVFFFLKKNIFLGLGERRTRYVLKYPNNYTLYNQDKGTPADGTNLYGFFLFFIYIYTYT
jgi:hypothetical protein